MGSSTSIDDPNFPFTRFAASSRVGVRPDPSHQRLWSPVAPLSSGVTTTGLRTAPPHGLRSNRYPRVSKPRESPFLSSEGQFMTPFSELHEPTMAEAIAPPPATIETQHWVRRIRSLIGRIELTSYGESIP